MHYTLHSSNTNFQLLRGLLNPLALLSNISCRNKDQARACHSGEYSYWDVGITLDAIEYAKDADVVVLASGDGDFDLLVDKIRKDLNAIVEVYGVPKFTSTSLISSASKYIPINKNLLLDASKR